MRVVVQRVTRASVVVDGEVVGAIELGLLVLVAFTADDNQADVDWMAAKIVGLRVFPDDDGKMNRSLAEVSGQLLVVSQFTLYGDVSRGRRPSFVKAADPKIAVPLYEAFVGAVRDRHIPVETGTFGAMMEIELVNDGPVTLVIER